MSHMTKPVLDIELASLDLVWWFRDGRPYIARLVGDASGGGSSPYSIA